MKKLIVLFMLFGAAYGQTPTYTPMRSFYEYKGIKMDSLFLLPTFSDTTSANLARTKSIDKSVINAGNVVYVRDVSQNRWVRLGPDSNFGNTDITANGDRLHDFAGNTLAITNTNNIGLYNGSGPYYGSMILYNYQGPALTSSIEPNGMKTEMKLDTNQITISSINNSASPTTGSKIIIDTTNVQFQFVSSPVQYYYFPNTSPSANTVMGYTSANTLGWVDINPAFDAAVDLSATDYTAPKWGVFTVTINTGSQNFLVPDPGDNDGKYITIINTTASDVTLGGATIYPKGDMTTSITTIGALEMLVAYSDGAGWYGFIQ